MASNGNPDGEDLLDVLAGGDGPASWDDISVEQEEPVKRANRRANATDGPPCSACGAPLSTIRINVDGRTLLMESCDICDTRRWQLAGEQIDLQEALNQVGEHSGRRRSRT